MDKPDVLVELARQREQMEAAIESTYGMYSIVFNGLVRDGLTREEALLMTPAIMDKVFSMANKSGE